MTRLLRLFFTNGDLTNLACALAFLCIEAWLIGMNVA